MDRSATVEGVRYLKRLRPLLKRLRKVGCERDKARNRKLFMDQLAGLVLLSFFNPCMKTLRDLEGASRVKRVRKQLQCSEASLGSLSEALRLFDADCLREILRDLLRQVAASQRVDPRLKRLSLIPTAVDGTLLLRLPQITQACFASRKDRGWKLHAHFEILRGSPVLAEVTTGDGKGRASEKAVLQRMLEPDRCYITDRGYENFALFNAIVAAKSGYVCRVRGDHAFTAYESRTLSEDDRKAGVLRDEVGRMGSAKSVRIEHPDHDQRRVEVEVAAHPKRGGRGASADSRHLVLVTNLLDVPAEVLVLLYRNRWLIELFFRWFKCVLQCRHLMSESRNGVAFQAYCGLIAFLLVQLAGGCDVKPTSWTYKLLCLYMQGWADEDDVLAHLRKIAAQQAARAEK